MYQETPHKVYEAHGNMTQTLFLLLFYLIRYVTDKIAEFTIFFVSARKYIDIYLTSDSIAVNQINSLKIHFSKNKAIILRFLVKLDSLSSSEIKL